MNKTRWEQIENLYHAALDRPPAERPGFLRGQCDGDAELFLEVESLLSSADSTDHFMATPEFEVGLKILAKPDHVLRAGQDFGHYKVLDFVGRGGMGEVYLAEDTRLGRKVALKVLPADMAADQERIRRFIQEARAASALNHPNILTIHEIGQTDGWRFIASEFVEGLNLRARLMSAEPLSVQGFIDVAVQIATALNAAHKVGIVHRDIKPENVMLREDGLVKVLDFGLAKLVKAPGGGKTATGFESTTPGMIMGTVAYMSPEQTRGKKTDARTDIWSLGVVMYEILAGRLPFAGDTSSDLIAAILTAEPALPPHEPMRMPRDLKQIVAKALRKDPAERYQSAKEMADELRAVGADESTLPTARFRHATDFNLIGASEAQFNSTAEVLTLAPPQAVQSGSRAPKMWLAVASILVLVSAAGFAGFSILTNSSWFEREPMNITRIFDAGKTVSAAISPDGKYIAHALSDAGKQSLWIKHIATNSNVQLIGPDRVGYKIIGFSKDGSYIYFQNGSGLSQIPVLGGDAKKINAGAEGSVSFSPDERRFTYIKTLSENENALMIVDVDGGGEQQLAAPEAPMSLAGRPAWSPDGKSIACGVFIGKGATATIMLFPAAGGDGKPFSEEQWRGVDELQWLPDGSALLAVAGPAEGKGLSQIWLLSASGEAPRLITNDLSSYSEMSITADAKQLLAIQWENRVNMWHLPGGKAEEARLLSSNIHSQFRHVALTPDGRIVFPSAGAADGTRDIWIMNSDGTGARRLTDAGHNILPCATSDGKYVVFASNRGGESKTYHIWRIRLDGSEPLQLTNGPRGERGPACSPDPDTVVYATGGPEAGIEKSNIWKVSVNGGEPTQLTDYPSLAPDVSPDGRHVSIRLQLDPSGPIKLGIIPISGGQPIKVFDTKHAAPIRWKPDGRSITYVRYDDSVANLWEQSVDGTPPKPITKFTGETIQGFAWAKNGDLLCARGFEARDPVLISNFK